MSENPLTVVSQRPEVWRTLFLRSLRSTGNLRSAAESVGVTTKQVRAAIRQDSSFASLVVEASEDFTLKLEGEAARRAMNGSDLLLMFVLKALKPEKYREKTTINGGPTVNVKTYVGFSPDDWDRGQTVDAVATQVVLTENASDSEPHSSIQTPALADQSAPSD